MTHQSYSGFCFVSFPLLQRSVALASKDWVGVGWGGAGVGGGAVRCGVVCGGAACGEVRQSPMCEARSDGVVVGGVRGGWVGVQWCGGVGWGVFRCGEVV